MNSNERFKKQHVNYFTRWQPSQYHSGCGGLTNRDSIFVYSFALKPEEHQPSGTCNFSRIDNTQLELMNMRSGDDGMKFVSAARGVDSFHQPIKTELDLVVTL